MKPLRSTTAAPLAALVMLLVPPPARAQAPEYDAAVLPGFERYGFRDPAAVGLRSVSLFTIPFGARMTVSRLELELAGAYASGTLARASGPSATLAGPTDTGIRLSAPLAGDRVTLTGTFVLPTGRARQTLEEAEVAGVVAADLLPFRISNWGSGGGAGLSATLALPLTGGLGLAARLGFQAAREFEPIEEQEFSYRPGHLLHGDVALDGPLGPAGKAKLHLTFHRFADDAFDGRNLYRSGDRVQLVGSYAFAAGVASTAVAYAGLLHRSRGTYATGAQDVPAQDLILAGGALRIPTDIGLLLPGLDVRVFRSADGVGQGYTAGLGSAAEIALGAGGPVLVPTVRARVGKVLVRQGSATGVTGFEVGAGLRFGGTTP